MRRTFFFKFMFLIALLSFGSCEDETDIPAGLFVETGELIDTYANDNVVIKATISDEVGISTISLKCEKWAIAKEYNLDEQKPVVFNVNYQFTVPESAGRDFDEVLVFEIVNTSGLRTVREVKLKYLPDTAKPELSNYKESITVNIVDGNAVYQTNFALSDDRGLKSVKLEVEGIGFSESKTISGLIYSFTEELTFDEVKSYPAKLSVVDSSDNLSEYDMTFIVMVDEDEDPISDYDVMFVVNTDNNPDDYIVGYYQPLTHGDPYVYSGYFYAPNDNTDIAFVPTQAMDGDFFGVSPYVSTKLINKNGYALPITIAKKGYYKIQINIENKSYLIEAHTPTLSDKFMLAKDMLCVSGTGFEHADWGMSSFLLPDNGIQSRMKGDFGVRIDAGGQVSFCFTSSDWAHIWRPDKGTTTQITGWYYSAAGIMFDFESAGVGSYSFLFDIGISPAWVTIKKPI